MLVLASLLALAASFSGHIDTGAYSNIAISHAVFDENTTFIGRHAFHNTNLTNARFESTGVVIEDGAFDDSPVTVGVACQNYTVTCTTYENCSVDRVYNLLRATCRDADSAGSLVEDEVYETIC